VLKDVSKRVSLNLKFVIVL